MLSSAICEIPSDTLHFRCLTLPDSASVTCQLPILSLSEQPPAKPLAILHTFSIPEFCVSPQQYTFAPSAWHICVQHLGEHVEPPPQNPHSQPLVEPPPQNPHSQPLVAEQVLLWSLFLFDPSAAIDLKEHRMAVTYPGRHALQTLSELYMSMSEHTYSTSLYQIHHIVFQCQQGLEL